jgi:pyridoxal phosphate enzyme (YggS family)
MIAGNFRSIKEKIVSAASRIGRDPDEIRIVAAAKGQNPEAIREAVQAGVTIVGHNYLQEALQVTNALEIKPVEHHMIGHLQRNKAGKAADIFDTVQTVDNEKLASALNNRCQDNGRRMGILIQVNLAREPQKSGIPEEEVAPLADYILTLPCLKLKGLMTMPPFFDDPERARPYFAGLRELRERLQRDGVFSPEMKELSMGMTGDFEAAVEEGATLVRIGTALFGARQ